MFSTVPIDQLSLDDDEKKLITNEAEKARAWVLNKRPFDIIQEIRFGNGIAGIIVSFLFKTQNSQSKEDCYLWVIYGDIPSYYLEIDKYDIEDGEHAIFTYCELMTQWVESVKNNHLTEDLPKINVPPTIDLALNLENRINNIAKIFLDEF